MQPPTPPLAQPGHSQPADPAAAGVRSPASIKSADLFRGQKAVTIDHNGSLYKLQTTKSGKLILTK